MGLERSFQVRNRRGRGRSKSRRRGKGRERSRNRGRDIGRSRNMGRSRGRRRRHIGWDRGGSSGGKWLPSSLGGAASVGAERLVVSVADAWAGVIEDGFAVVFGLIQVCLQAVNGSL